MNKGSKGDMDRPQARLHFRLMSLCLKCRDLFVSPRRILQEAKIERGFYVLDYGCGPGSFLIPLAESVGESGWIYALDVDPLAVRKVKRIASRRGLTNVAAIHSDCETGLTDESVDAVLLYDTLHAVGDAEKLLRELQRVLKPNGILSFSDHHMGVAEIVSRVTRAGLFGLFGKGKKTFTFLKLRNK